MDLETNRLAKSGRLDIESYNLNLAYSDLSDLKKPRLQTKAESLTLEDEVFDAVLCSELLEHVQEPPRVMQKIIRVLSRTGTALTCVPFMNRVHGDSHAYGRHTDYSWLEILTNIGFHDA